MYSYVYEFLKRNKPANSADETNGRHIIAPLIAGLCRSTAAPNILDVGAGYGKDLLAIMQALPNATTSAVEGYPQAVKALRASGINVVSIDVERDSLPFADATFDVVMCNQVIEHTKELFWVVSELARVCKVNGHLMIGVPNLGSFHNRIALLFGRQPPAIHVFGPHVRGFTNAGLRDFLETERLLKVERIVGANFYPLPTSISRPLARWFPGLAVSSFFVVKKLNNTSFLKVFDSARGAELADTPYYRGS